MHPPPGEPSYAEKEIWIEPDPPVAGQPAEICVELHNYANVNQTADLTLSYADFGAGTAFQEVGRLEDVLFPANTTVTRCITWQVPPGAGHVCLQVKIEQENYEDIVSQMNINTVGLPGVLLLPAEFEFDVGNPTGETVTVQLDVDEVGLPDGVSADIVEGSQVTLGPGETASRTLRIQTTTQAVTVLNGATMPGDAHLVSVEAFINDELVGGVQFEFEAVAPTSTPLPLLVLAQPPPRQRPPAHHSLPPYRRRRSPPPQRLPLRQESAGWARSPATPPSRGQAAQLCYGFPWMG